MLVAINTTAAPTTLGVSAEGAVCELSRRGRLTRVVDRSSVNVGGVLLVRAQDRRETDAFEGAVVEGDIALIRR